MDESPTVIRFHPLHPDWIEHCLEDAYESGTIEDWNNPTGFTCICCRRQLKDAYKDAQYGMSVNGGKGGWICSSCIESFRDPPSLGAKLFR